MAKTLNKYKDGIPAGSVYIGRPSKWGNPFVIGEDGTRAEVIAKYRSWLQTRPDLLAAARSELAGKDLVCLCAPQACHGDVLIEIAGQDEPTSQPAEPVKDEPASKPEACEYCNGTGDVHDIAGEWRGKCKDCDNSKPASDAPAQEYTLAERLQHREKQLESAHKQLSDLREKLVHAHAAIYAGVTDRVAQPAAPLSNAEFLSARLGRVAKLVGVPMPNMSHEGIAEVAGAILGGIARKLEVAQQKDCALLDEVDAILAECHGKHPHVNGTRSRIVKARYALRALKTEQPAAQMTFNTICGQNITPLDADLVGCGKPISPPDEVYRCTDCSVPFHRACAVKHFEEDTPENAAKKFDEQLRRLDAADATEGRLLGSAKTEGGKAQ